MGVPGKRVEKSGVGSRARTMAGAGPTDLFFGSKALFAAYRRRGAWALMSPAQVDPGVHRVTVDDIIRELSVEAQEERRYSERRTGTDMEDIVAFCEEACRKRCHLRVPAEESDEVTSCCSGSKTGRYRERISPKPSKGDGGTAMEMTPSPVRRLFSAASDSEGYPTCYPSDNTDIEPDLRQAGRVPPQILNLLMKQNGNHCCEGQLPPESLDTPISGRREWRPWAMVKMEMVKKMGGWTVTGRATSS